MRREHFTNLILWLGAAFLGVALMAVPTLFPKLPLLVLRLLFFGGLAAASACMFAWAIAVVRERPNREEGDRMIAAVGMVVCGAGFIACCAWFFWPSKSAILPPPFPAAPVDLEVPLKEFKSLPGATAAQPAQSAAKPQRVLAPAAHEPTLGAEGYSDKQSAEPNTPEDSGERSDFIRQLWNRWLDRDGVTPDQAAGLDPPPEEWMNERLTHYEKDFRVRRRGTGFEIVMVNATAP